MGDIKSPAPVLMISAAFSRYDEALRWGAERAAAEWGPIALISPTFDFIETEYYIPTMGPGIKKCFWAFEQLVDPGKLPQRKIESNAWEDEYAALGNRNCRRSRTPREAGQVIEADGPCADYRATKSLCHNRMVRFYPVALGRCIGKKL